MSRSRSTARKSNRALSRTSALEAGLRHVWRLPSTMEVVGDLRGDTDMSIDGRFSGSVSAQENHVTISASARVSADIAARTVLVRGQVVGNITAAEKVTIASIGSVRGDIRAPRVCLGDGSTVTGRITSEGPSIGTSLGSN